MKKVILSLTIVIVSIGAKAQNSFGLQTGANFGTVRTKDGSIENTSKVKVGFLLGAIADVDFGNSVSFRPELNFIQKGGKEENTKTNSDFTTTERQDLKLNYIQLVPNFVYNFSAGSNKLFFGVGPEFGIGISGKNKYEKIVSGNGITTTKSETQDVKFDGNKTYTDNTHLKSFDLGANAIIGLKLNNGGFVSAGYIVGLQNISPYNNSSFKNNGFNLKIGYLFGGSSKTKK